MAFQGGLDEQPHLHKDQRRGEDEASHQRDLHHQYESSRRLKDAEGQLLNTRLLRAYLRRQPQCAKQWTAHRPGQSSTNRHIDQHPQDAHTQLI